MILHSKQELESKLLSIIPAIRRCKHIKNISVLLEPESNHSTVEESPVAAPPLPPLIHSPFKGLILPINFHNYLPLSLSGTASLPSASTITTSPKTSTKNVSSKDPSGKQSRPTTDSQMHVSKPSSPVSSISKHTCMSKTKPISNI